VALLSGLNEILRPVGGATARPHSLKFSKFGKNGCEHNVAPLPGGGKTLRPVGGATARPNPLNFAKICKRRQKVVWLSCLARVKLYAPSEAQLHAQLSAVEDGRCKASTPEEAAPTSDGACAGALLELRCRSNDVLSAWSDKSSKGSKSNPVDAGWGAALVEEATLGAVRTGSEALLEDSCCLSASRKARHSRPRVFLRLPNRLYSDASSWRSCVALDRLSKFKDLG
jgi:hypothetical protein